MTAKRHQHLSRWRRSIQVCGERVLLSQFSVPASTLGKRQASYMVHNAVLCFPRSYFISVQYSTYVLLLQKKRADPYENPASLLRLRPPYIAVDSTLVNASSDLPRVDGEGLHEGAKSACQFPVALVRG